MVCTTLLLRSYTRSLGDTHQQALNSLCSSIHASQYSSAFPTSIGLQLHSLALPGFHRRDHGLTYKISCGSLSTSNNECSDHSPHLLEVFMSAKCSATACIQKNCPGKHVRVLSPYQWKGSWKDPWMGYKHPAAQIPGADTRCIHQLLLKGYDDNPSGLDNKSPCNYSTPLSAEPCKEGSSKATQVPNVIPQLHTQDLLSYCYWMNWHSPTTAKDARYLSCQQMWNCSPGRSLFTGSACTTHDQYACQDWSPRSLTSRKSFPLILDRWGQIPP